MWDALILPMFFISGGIALALLMHGWPSFINITHVHNHAKDDEE